MTKNTHIITASLISFPLITNPISLFGLIGAIFPDYDCKLNMKCHRTLSHSILFLLITTIPFIYINKELALIWFISYCSHLILDSLTKSGIPLFYGISKKRYGLKLFITDGILDNTLHCIFWILLIVVFIYKL